MFTHIISDHFPGDKLFVGFVSNNFPIVFFLTNSLALGFVFELIPVHMQWHLAAFTIQNVKYEQWPKSRHDMSLVTYQNILTFVLFQEDEDS